jgi:hypothetical protein
MVSCFCLITSSSSSYSIQEVRSVLALTGVSLPEISSEVVLGSLVPGFVSFSSLETLPLSILSHCDSDIASLCSSFNVSSFIL